MGVLSYHVCCMGLSGRSVYILSLGVGRLSVAYPYVGAMREPESGGK